MTNRPEFTHEQQDWIISTIAIWYLKHTSLFSGNATNLFNFSQSVKELLLFLELKTKEAESLFIEILIKEA